MLRIYHSFGNQKLNDYYVNNKGEKKHLERVDIVLGIELGH